MKWLLSPYVLIISLAISLLAGVGYVRAYLKDRSLEIEIEALKNQQESLERKKMDLTSLFRKVETDEYAREHAREELGMHEVGEKAVVIENVKEETGSQKKKKEMTKSNPQKWFEYFFGELR